MNIDKIRRLALLVIRFAKILVYCILGSFLFLNIVGAEGLVEILKVEQVSQSGMNQVNLIIPNYVLLLTFGAVILEVVSNSLELPDYMK